MAEGVCASCAAWYVRVSQVLEALCEASRAQLTPLVVHSFDAMPLKEQVVHAASAALMVRRRRHIQWAPHTSPSAIHAHASPHCMYMYALASLTLEACVKRV